MPIEMLEATRLELIRDLIADGMDPVEAAQRVDDLFRGVAHPM